MKKLISVLFIVFQFSFFAFSHDFHLSVEPLFGLRNGQIDEFVYYNKAVYSNDKLSELNWDLKNEFYLGGKINGGYKNFLAEIGFNAAVPKSSGIMRDSDWLNVMYSGLQNYQYKTNYSESDNNLEYDVDFEIKTSYKINIYKNDFFTASVSPSLGFEYKTYEFKAEDGYYWYGNKVDGIYSPYTDSSNRRESSLNGDVVSYNRQTYYMWAGFDVSFDIQKCVLINAGFELSPYLYSESIDTHYMNRSDGLATNYGDKTPANLGAFKWNFGVEYTLKKRHSFCLNANYLFMRQLRGPDYTKISSETFYKRDKSADGGAAEHYFDISLSYKFKIF